jgi:hypothetical protein
MSNLGGYQKIVKAAKTVGGPRNFVLLTFVVGVAVGIGVEVGTKKIVKTVKSKSNNRKGLVETENLSLDVIADGKDNNVLEFHVGDKYRILESDGDAILIEKLGDDNNPYFVSSDFLNVISDFIPDAAKGKGNSM